MFDIFSLRPDDTPEYMNPAWLGCIHWALGKEDIMCAFRDETGNEWRPGRTPTDRMIDSACGADEKFLTEFIEWANVNVWGKMDGEEE